MCIDDEIPFELPKGWTWSRLASLLTRLQSGCDLKPSQYNDRCEGIPYMTGASNINNGQLIRNRWTTEPKTLAHRNDILLSCKGTVGLTAVVQDPIVHIARQFMALQLESKTNNVCSGYVRLFIERNSARLSKNSTGLIPGIDRDSIQGLTIPLPPAAEQYRILNVLQNCLALL